jgi:hypothetical protein
VAKKAKYLSSANVERQTIYGNDAIKITRQLVGGNSRLVDHLGKLYEKEADRTPYRREFKLAVRLSWTTGKAMPQRS